MLKSFIWMFNTENFKKHFLYLFFGSLILYLIAFSLIFTNIALFIPIAYLLSVVPTLYILGYFWNLVEQIINRDLDIQTNSIYNGKIKEVNIVTLPGLNLWKNLWRGVAFIFALILLMLPFIGLFWLGTKYGTLIALTPAYSIFIILFCIFLVPAMLWNYAYRDSVVSVWNLRKVIYLIGNYPSRYFSRVIVIAVLVFVNSLVDSVFVKLLPTTAEAFANIDFWGLIVAIIVCIVFGIKYLYFTYVNAYLLGTIAPTSEV